MPSSSPDSSEVSVLVRFFRSTFGFRKTTVTLVTILSYVLSVLVASYFQYEVNQPPQPEPAILTSSWYDLQRISEKFHPYDSHANDEVHDYILKRTEELASQKAYISVNDTFGQQSLFKDSVYVGYNRIVSYEDGNVLVKVDGKDTSLPGVLISAHYDSVPTAYGTTDDGMGIASMLGILQHLVEKADQPERTIVFNFNNNEEAGLFGAETFFNHEWSKLVTHFINMEGTGTGDRAILFRATDSGVSKYYGAAPRPFANSLFQLGFDSGLIHSETDYKIYKQHGLRGLDIAFYKPRNLYHTPRDGISAVSKGSLWHMESSALAAMNAMAYSDEPLDEDLSPAVFFDILGVFFFSFPVEKVYGITVALLVAVPVAIIFLLIIVIRRGTWHISLLRGWLRVPVSLLISSVAVFTTGKTLLLYNPLLLASNWFGACVLLTSTFLLINYLLLNFFAWIRPIHDQKLVALLEVNGLIWLANIYLAIKEKSHNNVGGASLLVLYVLTSASSLFGLVVMALKSTNRYRPLPKSSPVAYGATESEEAAENGSSSTPAPEAESTPLLSSQSSAKSQVDSEAEFNRKQYEHALHSFHYDWLLQFLIVAPLSILVVYLTGDLLLQGLGKTSQESARLGGATMEFLSIFAVLLGLPVVAFVHKFNAIMAVLLAITVLTSSVFTVLEPSYSWSSPLKVRFVQTIDLSGSKQPVVSLQARSGFITDVLNDIPSIKNSDDAVICDTNADDSEICQYVGLRPWLVDGSAKKNAFNHYLDVEVVNSTGDGRFSPFEAEIKIWAQQNRDCVVYFNTSNYDSLEAKAGNHNLVSPVKQVTIHHGKHVNSSTVGVDSVVPSGYSIDPVTGDEYFKLSSGIDEVKLYKVDWNRPYYHLGLKWMVPWDSDSEADGLGIQVRCLWGEADETTIVGGEKKRKVPAFEELVRYSPSNVVYSNLAMGFVEIRESVNL
ncbi:unnamed protein product [Kuraishia capsulata CBS 1993]|uniref:Peptide hydrolase n=1 Tax=Kuraishia capsulata CBS 1993 TaxID=1382522 RepID=W6MN21_9ASCO|nr:uncharacterized protein KUCA_T00002399001 [Kuraishia capsulata CBS 1993]CDK26427.1 unnamed protein product [Kuraishia capsulata CBS 1993]